MGRSTNIARLRQAAELARDRGVTVQFDAGWTRNGRAGLRPVGHVNHTTEDRSQLSESRMREVLRDGHGSISGNAICNAAIMRSAELWVIAAGVAWHAGRGSWKGHGGNSRWLGTEYQRARGRPLSARQLDVGRIWDWALMQAFGWPAVMVPDHFDYAGARKQDRQLRDGVRIDSAAWRRSLTEPGGEPEPDTEPDDEPLEGDEMIHLWKGTSPGGTHGYWLVQFRLDADRPGRRGIYAAVRPDELKQWQHRAESDRVPDVVDATKHEAQPNWFDRLDPADG